MNLTTEKPTLPFNLYADFADAGESLKSNKQAKELAWLQQRRGKFTASEFHRLMTYEKKGVHLPDGAKNYAESKAIELLTNFDENTPKFRNEYTDWGNSYEVEAVETFMKVKGLTVENYGDNQEFIDAGELGCTPDGLIGDEFGIETKCPDSKTHINYLKFQYAECLKKDCANYYWQVQGSRFKVQWQLRDVKRGGLSRMTRVLKTNPCG